VLLQHARPPSRLDSLEAPRRSTPPAGAAALDTTLARGEVSPILAERVPRDVRIMHEADLGAGIDTLPDDRPAGPAPQRRASLSPLKSARSRPSMSARSRATPVLARQASPVRQSRGSAWDPSR
jgi:hypothetical protein